MPATNPGTTGLEAYLAYESGALTTDSHNSHTLTNQNTVTSVAGKVGNAANFVGASSQKLYILDANCGALDVGDSSFWFSLWFKVTSTAGAQVLTNKFTSATAGPWSLFLNGSTLTWRIFGTPTLADVTWGTAISTATWYHVACWYTAGGGERGVVVNAGTPVTVASGVTAVASSGDLNIGGAAGAYTTGNLDEFAIYLRAKPTADELTWLFNAGAGRTYAELSASGAKPMMMQAAALMGAM